jgi:Tol biopolymer transport system component
MSDRGLGRSEAPTVVLALIVLTAAVACDRAGTPGRAATPDANRTATPRSSADLLVFERRIGGNLDLYTVPAGGGVERRLTDDPADDSLPRWTPDGRAIVFASNRTGNWQLWEMPAGGGAARRLRANAARELEADPSPDGKSVAFLSNLDGPESLWVMDRATGRARVLVRQGARTILGNPSFSPDGHRLVYSSNVWMGHQIYVWDDGTRQATRISSLTRGGCGPRFSRDGRKVIYVTRRHLRTTSWIVEQDLGTGQEKTLVDWPALNYDPTCSPDGSEIAFASNITGEYEVYRQRLADGRAWRVTFGKGPARVPDYEPAPGR